MDITVLGQFVSELCYVGVPFQASVLVARLSNVQCCVQMLGDNACTVLNLAIPGINLEEHPKTTLSKFIVTNAKCKYAFF